MSANLNERLHQWKPLSEAEEDLFTNLPPEITRDILRRVPLRSITRCKRVCKSWRDLIEEDEFVTSYTTKPCLVLSDRLKGGYVVCDEVHEPLFRFDVPPPCNENSYIIGTANGLLLVRDIWNNILFTLNPVTRDYIELDPLPEQGSIGRKYTFGFGVSKLSGQYKILYVSRSMSHFVHTHLGGGGGGWRSISAPPWLSPYEINFHDDESAAFFNGNLHWLVFNFFRDPLLCCFDLETELFTSFSLPSHFDGYSRKVCVLEGRLCVCHVSLCERAVIWLMKDYGDENSWVKEYTFTHDQREKRVRPLKILANGDLVFATICETWLFIYSKSTDSTVEHSILRRPYYCSHTYSSFVIYTPGLNLLKLHPKLTLAT
ncbi:F-box protein At3g07870-like [Salvia hispanica]|uniref:F-box protein At3g07870-like n=1 Tax=Salvia hispanica TaxID=49212 RepID=UPI00200914C9|nr:F-box protein At3g07870-like [Salvia hispanica]